MTTDRDFERIALAWLADGPEELSDRVLDAVVDEIHVTQQRHALRLPWRFPSMTTPARVAAAAAIGVLAIGGALYAFNSQPSVGGPGPTPTPTISPSPTPIAFRASSLGASLAAGRYRFAEPFLVPVTLTVPANWRMDQLAQGVAKIVAPSGREFDFVLVDQVPNDPCHSDKGNRTISETDVNGLVDALTHMAGFAAGPVTTTTIGGLPARHFSISNAIDTVVAACTGGTMLLLFHVVGGVSPATNGGTSQELWVIDVAGRPLLLLADPPTSDWSATDQAAFQAIVDSIQIEP